MNQYVELFAENVQEVLDRKPESENDFVSLAVAGEQLRRSQLIAEETSVMAARVLERYDDFLSRYRGQVPAGLERDLSGALVELEVYARAPSWGRDAGDGEEILMGIEQVLSVAAAARRIGRQPEEELKRLASMARDRIADLTPELQDLWQFAEDRLLTFAPDPDCPELFDWWEELAQFSPSRVELQVALKNRLVLEKAVERYADSLSRKPLIEKLKEKIDELGSILVPMPQISPQPAYFSSDEGTPPDVVPVHDFDGLLHVLREDRHLALASTARKLSCPSSR
jgi:hypothetical protein